MIRSFILLGLLFLSACQTPRIVEFESVNLGEQKTDVIEAVGNPTVAQRKSGQDRWIYRLYDKDILVEKWVIFQEGYVVYKGDPVPPLISAEEQDLINIKQNIELQKIRIPSSYKKKSEDKVLSGAN